MTTPDAGSWVLIVYLGVVTMAFAYFLLYAGLRSTPAAPRWWPPSWNQSPRSSSRCSFSTRPCLWPGGLGCLLILGAIGGLGRRMEQPQVQ